MRAVLQRVLNASVTINNEVIANINNGIVALIGINKNDNIETFKYMCDKMINLRIFEDENNKLNLSLKDLNFEILIVPNFTIYSDARKGRRPNFVGGANPSEAEHIFNDFISYVKQNFENVKTGKFRADMKISLINDGPVTILLDSDKLF